MKIKNLYFIISFFAINFTRAQPFGESNLPFENNEITIENEVHYLKTGDYLQIPLNVGHNLVVTSSIPCKVILQRVAA